MVKSFFLGLGTTVAVLWGIWGFCNTVYHGSIGQNGNWWGLWDWISVAPLIAGALFFIGWVFVGMGEHIRDRNGW